MIVPALSKGSGAHGVWPGIQNENAGFVYQSVISDSKVPGTWQFFVEYCCNPDYQASAVRGTANQTFKLYACSRLTVTVWPGDSITSTFSMGANSVWTDSWSLSPGLAGQAAGQRSQSGSSSNSFAGKGTINKALLAIELQSGATWDFGQVQWSSISITASTKQSFCSTGYSVTGGLKYSVSGCSTSTQDSSTTCSYNRITFGQVRYSKKQKAVLLQGGKLWFPQWDFGYP
ncbi:hypothetical protein VTL71DRAFT_642 [Oculimacula yallundae]|uniref:Uncharacterized protein n=1 Tax=Oculimacula yallundae TaxID=86028 RepID=A0ABR4D0M4_9HELO